MAVIDIYASTWF